jgi:hypothetical protein
MPNHIKNRLTLIGAPERVFELINKFGTKEKASLNTSYDNDIICRSESGGVGWLNLQTGMFRRREEKDVIGLPLDFKLDVKDSTFTFPDLNKIVPMPEILVGTNAPNRENAAECKTETGHEDWYSWQVENWGVKWGTYDHYQTQWNVFEFDTAWSNISRMIDLMHSEFNDIRMIYEWSDEDTGANCGHSEFVNGQSYVRKYENHSEEAFKMAFKLRPETADEYEIVDGSWKYKEE